MKLSINSWHYKFHNFVYFWQDTAPRSFCAYFWQLLLGFVILPLAWPAYVLNICIRKPFAPIILGIVVNAAFICTGQLMHRDLGLDSYTLSYFYGIGALLGITLLIAALLGVLFGATYLVIFGLSKLKKPKLKYEDKPSLIKMRIKAFKEKNCPIIEWRNN